MSNMIKANLHRGIIDEFSKMQVPICVINAYPYKGYWCNDAWLELWECDTLEDWLERTSKTMDNWSQATHLQMKNLRDRVQIKKETSFHTFHVYRNEKKKVVSVYQRPIDWLGTTLVMHELVPEKGSVQNALKRSVEAFRYVATIVTVFDEKGTLLYQNPASEAFYSKSILGEVSQNETYRHQSSLQIFVGDAVVHDEIMSRIAKRESWSGLTVTRCKFQQALLQRRFNATYGLDPVSGGRMIVLDESYCFLADSDDGKLDYIEHVPISIPKTAAELEGTKFYRGSSAASEELLVAKVPRSSSSFASAMAKSMIKQHRSSWKGAVPSEKESGSSLPRNDSMDSEDMSVIDSIKDDKDLDTILDNIRTNDVEKSSLQEIDSSGSIKLTSDKACNTLPALFSEEIVPPAFPPVRESSDDLQEENATLKQRIEQYEEKVQWLVNRCKELTLVGTQEIDFIMSEED